MRVIGKVVCSAPAKEQSDFSDHLLQLSGRASDPTSFPGSLERGETLVGSGHVLP